jgi:cyclic pyranopterin phosphate synthase
MPGLVDSFGRCIDYLRVSVTDRCNYHCFYCRPPGTRADGSHHDFLRHEETARLVRLFSELGVSKVRLTGGEPLLRRNIEGLAAMIAGLPGVDDLSLSTNGHLLQRFAAPLKTAGVGRVNISVDSLDQDTFSAITRGGDLGQVLRGIDAAQAAGMTPIKINMVVMKGINKHEIYAMLDFALERGLELRFIETMPVGKAGADNMDCHYPTARILQRIRKHYGSKLIPMQARSGPGPARYYQVGDSDMKVGVISAVSRHFCETCNRVRLTARGDLVLCLGHEDRISLRSALREGRSDVDIKQDILAAIARKPERHYFNSDAEQRGATQMVSLGG